MTDRMWTIGEVASRAGIATSALRFYEAEGLITAARTAGGRRTFPPAILRRVAFIRAAQRAGLTLDEVRTALASLPRSRTPNKSDWAALARSWTPRIEQQIEALAKLRDELADCIGCGCLSLRSCKLYNPGDAAASLGTGARYLLGDPPELVTRTPPGKRGARSP